MGNRFKDSGSTFLVVALSASTILVVVIIICLPHFLYQYVAVSVFSKSFLLHLLFNSLVVAILARAYYDRYTKRRNNELNKSSSFVYFAQDKMEEHYDEESGRMSSRGYNGYHYDDNGDDIDSDDDEYYQYSSDGYDKEDDDDDDDNGGYGGDIEWEEDEDEEYDSELEARTEAFIAKVVNGWKDEWLRENTHTRIV